MSREMIGQLSFLRNQEVVMIVSNIQFSLFSFYVIIRFWLVEIPFLVVLFVYVFVRKTANRDDGRMEWMNDV